MHFESLRELLECISYERNIYLKGKKILLFFIPIDFLEDQVLFKYVFFLRMTEYFTERRSLKLVSKICKLVFYRYQLKYLMFIPPYTVGKGISIAHVGPIRINGKVHCGNNMRLHAFVNIGANEGVPCIGDNVYIGPGVKMFGKVNVADGCYIGANAVVTKSCDEENGVYVGVPAKLVRVKTNSKDWVASENQ